MFSVAPSYTFGRQMEAIHVMLVKHANLSLKGREHQTEIAKLDNY